MATDSALNVYIGWDSREAVASDVAAHSIRRRSKADLKIHYLKHRELRAQGWFRRPWQIDGATGDFRDVIDGRPFSTEFSHTRFLVPALQDYQGWALFMDSDMVFLTDIKQLFKLADERYAVMCVKHRHTPPQDSIKMDGRLQQQYYRKNWSSFMLWNCAHPSNRYLKKERVNYLMGGDMHAMCWLDDDEIGSLPYKYNYISGVSPKLTPEELKGSDLMPHVIHYTEGGPWFDTCKDVPYANIWVDEFEEWQREADHGAKVVSIPATKYDRADPIRKIHLRQA
jgi:lipopolysaccharide biosynthesis glycosyltransferase